MIAVIKKKALIKFFLCHLSKFSLRRKKRALAIK